MCLQNEKGPEVLKRDMIVWKEVRKGSRRSLAYYVRGLSYAKGSHHKVSPDLLDDSGFYVYYGIDGWINRHIMGLIRIGNIVIRCKIPKGATVIKGTFAGISALRASEIIVLS